MIVRLTLNYSKIAYSYFNKENLYFVEKMFRLIKLISGMVRTHSQHQHFERDIFAYFVGISQYTRYCFHVTMIVQTVMSSIAN